MDQDLDTAFCPAGTGIIFRDFGDEMVVANLDTGIFFSLGGSAPAIWAALAEGHSARGIATAFGGDPGILASIGGLLGQLRAEALLTPAASPAPAPAAGVAPWAFVTPLLERFDDLQGLLLVDPIHEVSEAGWPLAPQTLGGAG
ncbi:hypothetical protein C8P66_1515 [Humitalea rosea]|uniref:Coenzyme PQQ synthesis protein D (PqqD) n=1 Tax=Humitalea rosea TaxID=990373 RepID=A0A2W7JRC2_9PROT|nr:PqqD family protein [Humitalea rosea]PZW36953.1 hypothetical protein C8P66_1515 [Humitalea rosea]